MIDHRCKTYDPAIFITEKCYIFIMIILVSLQDRDQYLHGKLFRHFPMLLKKSSFKNISVIIKHLAVVYIIIYMGMLGAKKILLTNAAGGANPSYKPGDFMMITDHITTGVPSPLIGPNMDELGTRFPDMSEVYSRRLQDVIRKCAKECDIKLQEGVYVQFTGPNYETPAEVRLAQRWGGDAVGMSTACEAMAARHMGMEICGISCITNMAAGISQKELNHKEVQETADRVAKSFKELVTKVVVNM